MFTLDIKALNTNITFIKRAGGYSKRRYTTVAALEAIRLDIADGTATVGWFDYETSVEVRMPATGSDTVALPVEDLVSAIKAVGGKGIATFTVADGKLTIEVDGMTASVLLPEYGEDLPNMPEVDAAPILITTGGEFSTVTAAVGAAVGTDDTLPMLTGVRLDVGDTVQAATTDRFRLVVAEVPSTIL